MQAALDFIRERGGRAVVLDADGNSEAACILYKQIGFKHVFTSIEFNLEKDLTQDWTLPEGYEFITLKPSDWRTHYELAQSATPTHITHYDPVEESRYRAS